jgi:hypothetical protein
LTCQEEMEQVHLRVLVQALEEVPEWVDLVREEWVAPEQVQAQEGNVYVLNAARLLLMKQERRATL